MNLREYYGFPEGIKVDMKFIPHWLDDRPNFPMPTSCKYVFSRYGGYEVPLVDTSNVVDMSNMFDYGMLTTLNGAESWDTSNVTDMSYMFNYCEKLIDLGAVSNWNTSNVQNMRNAFNYCRTFKDVTPIGNWDVSNVNNMTYMFGYCVVEDLTPLSGWDTSNVTNMDSMFYSCANLLNVSAIGNWDTSKVTTMDGMLYGCGKITSIPYMNCISVERDKYPIKLYSNSTILTELGGFYMKNSWVNTYGLTKCPNLTVESLVNVLNALYDFTGNGETPNSNQGKLALGSTNLAKLSDEQKAIATNKGWTLS